MVAPLARSDLIRPIVRSFLGVIMITTLIIDHLVSINACFGSEPESLKWSRSRPLHPPKRTSRGQRRASAWCHVWTAPGWQEFFHVCSIGRCSHVFGLFARFT